MGNNIISLKLNIAGKIYPIRIEEGEAKSARKIEKELNQKISDYQIQYKDVDVKDSIAMLLISYAFEMHKLKSTQDAQIENKLDIIEQLVDSQLS